MPIRIFRFMIVLFVTVFVFGRICIAGTWIDDFSDRTLRDWGGGRRNHEFSTGVVGGHFYYRGIVEQAFCHMENRGLGKIQDFSLQLKFMVRNLRDLRQGFLTIDYSSFNEETWNTDGIMQFSWYPQGEPKINIMDVTIDCFEQEGDAFFPQTAAIDSFAFEEKVWYTLRIAREGNQYTFSMGDVILFAEDDSVSMGTIDLLFFGRCTVWLDDFTVTGPDVPNGGPGFLGVNPLAEQLTTMWGKLKARN